jgi:hypothetical protein
MRRTRTLVAIAGLVAVAVITPSRVAAQSFPGYSISYYMTSHNGTAAYNAGCSIGQAASNGGRPVSEHVVLDFGAPGYDSSAHTYGAWFYSPGYGYQTTAVITNIVYDFGEGFYDCSTSTPNLVIGAGVTSEGAGFITAHGTAWGHMINSINSLFVSHNLSSQVTAYGAIDAENESGWGSYAADKAWADAFSAADNYLYWDFGDAGGCSTTSYNNSVPCNLSWTQAMFYYLSWGAADGLPFPEIYATSGANASQWKMIVLYAYVYAGATTMDIDASLTQAAACVQKGGCSGTNNSASAGWTQMHNALISDSRTTQNLYWASDIRYGY